MITRCCLIVVALFSGFLLAASPASAQDKSATPSAKQRCDDLVGGRFSNLPEAPTWIVEATYHAATPERRAYCEIDGYVNPTVKFGMLLPAEGWNGRYLVRGCGGSCGKVWSEGTCGKHVRDGYACLQTDMGHYSSQIDNNWVANNLQGQVDFGYRSTHVTTIAGKAIAAAFLGKDPQHSYFFACSTGGRQAMVEAQRFPEDFDGIVALAPVGMANFGRGPKFSPRVNVGGDGHAILTDRQVPLIYKAVIAQCDLNDGVKDGLIEPRDCKFDPGMLQCKSGQAADSSCLTPAQVNVARKFYESGVQPGAELNWINNWTAEPGPPVEFAQSRGDAGVTATFNNAGNPDLTAFRDRNGKLILAHGSTDVIVPPAATTTYYETATRTMGGPEATHAFFRYFLIPGMDHCSGGDAAWGVNYLPLIERWVEQGQAPERIVGIRPKAGVELDYFGIDTDRLTPDQVAFSRPYYPYPLKAYYAGGDPNQADSFKPGTKPSGKKAQSGEAAIHGTDPQKIAADMLHIAALTEKAYAAAGLPPKNVSDRVGKQLRFEIYRSGITDELVKAALVSIDLSARSEPTRKALQLILPEYGL